MGAAYFYHLTDSPQEQVLAMLLTKARQAGWRVGVRGRDEDRMDWLDRKLWLIGDGGFLPHGLAGGPHDALQPILLTTATELANGASCIISVDGAEIAPAEVAAADRACILFDGNSAAAVETARGQWRTLTGAGCAAQYWAQEAGKWTMKTESGT